MSAVVAVFSFAVLFGAFALMAPVLARKQKCGGDSCGSCSGASCKFTEQEQ